MGVSTGGDESRIGPDDATAFSESVEGIGILELTVGVGTAPAFGLRWQKWRATALEQTGAFVKPARREMSRCR
jgi:hypothetical protein